MGRFDHFITGSVFGALFLFFVSFVVKPILTDMQAAWTETVHKGLYRRLWSFRMRTYYRRTRLLFRLSSEPVVLIRFVFVPVFFTAMAVLGSMPVHPSSHPLVLAPAIYSSIANLMSAMDWVYFFWNVGIWWYTYFTIRQSADSSLMKERLLKTDRHVATYEMRWGSKFSYAVPVEHSDSAGTIQSSTSEAPSERDRL